MSIFVQLFISAANCIRVGSGGRSTRVYLYVCGSVCTHTKLPQTPLSRTRGEWDDFTINDVVEMQYAVIVQDITITEQTDVLSYYAQKKSTETFAIQVLFK